MPVLGGTKVLPEALDQTYERLRAVLDRGAAPLGRVDTGD